METVSVTAKWSKADSLLLLLASIFFVPGGCLKLQGTMLWVVNVNVGTWSRVWSLNLFVDWSLLSTIESCMDSFFLNNSILDIVLLFLVIVLTGAWILGESLSGVWCFSLMLPKLTSFCFGQE